MINATDDIIVYIFQKADELAKHKEPYDSQKLIDLAYLRGQVSALYINQQISAERHWELNKELNCVKIIGSTFFSQAK